MVGIAEVGQPIANKLVIIKPLVKTSCKLCRGKFLKPSKLKVIDTRTGNFGIFHGQTEFNFHVFFYRQIKILLDKF